MQKNVDSAIQRLHAIFPSHPKPRGFVCDLSKPTIEQDLERLFEQVGKVDHIVYTAGDKLADFPLQDITLENMIAAGQVRVFAVLLTVKVGVRYLTNPKSTECSIILTTGTIWEHPRPDWTLVATYGAGLLGMTRNLALDLKPLRVNIVAPGPAATEMWEREGMSPEQIQKFYAAIVSKMATGRMPVPDDIAESYLYLMKDENITGRCISTDSGVTLM